VNYFSAALLRPLGYRGPLGTSAGLLLLTSLAAQAQRRPAAFPAPMPSPVEDPTLRRTDVGSTGRYQGLDGSWHAVQIGNWENDRVYLSDAGSTFKTYSPTDLKRFVLSGDTIAAVHDVVVKSRRFPRKKRPELVPAASAQQLYRGGGFQLVDYDSSQPSTVSSRLSSCLRWRRGRAAWQVVPMNTVKFNQLMLTLLGDNPELAAGLRAGQYRPRRDVARLLERYADWKTHQFLQSIALPTR
jgi:hypothetical protein